MRAVTMNVIFNHHLKAKAKVCEDCKDKHNRHDGINGVGICLDHTIVSGPEVIAERQNEKHRKRHERDGR